VSRWFAVALLSVAVYSQSRVEPQFVYSAKVDSIVDGDTMDLVIDLGFRTTTEQRVRLLGVDCPEVKGSTKKAGDAATEATRRWVKSHSGLVIRTLKTKKQADSFGRYLVEVFGDTDGKQESLNQHLLDEGFAVPYRE